MVVIIVYNTNFCFLYCIVKSITTGVIILPVHLFPSQMECEDGVCNSSHFLVV